MKSIETPALPASVVRCLAVWVLLAGGVGPAPADEVRILAGSPEEVEGRLELSREGRRLVQTGLSSAGHDPGPADGMFGRRTRKAIQQWQGTRGEAVTGYLDADGAKELLAMGEREAARLRAKAEERRRRARSPGTKFRDCPECPELVVVPSGSFMMGSPEHEDEGPVHRVTIGRPFAVGVYEVTRGEYGRFVSETGHSTGDSCRTYEDGEWKERTGRHWKRPGYSQTGSHPVVCVSWDDAKAYVRWLSGKAGAEYRLLSEAEWEYVSQGSTGTGMLLVQCEYANGADASTDIAGRAECNDGHARTAPVGKFLASGFGLYDVLGNAREWVEDCWNESYAGAPSDGSAWESGNCGRRVLRGGSWYDSPGFVVVGSTGRDWYTSGDRSSLIGFRIARTLAP